MDIIKIIGVGFISLIIIVLLRQYKPEFAIYVSIICGAIIIFMLIGKISVIYKLVEALSFKTSVNSDFIKILIKITGIAILTEFAVSVAKDSNETSIASKIDLGGKVIIIFLSMPIIQALLNTTLKLLP